MASAATMRRDEAQSAQTKPTALPRELDGIVHVLTCGSVDDGKSTLIGRMLWDSEALPDDQRQMVERAAQAANTPDRLDFSLLLDGLLAEREQGITIDIAWRYIDTATRRLVIIDSPGHEQYTRNMASGASHADVAVMLVDARSGLKKQTRRHAAILDLMGVRRVVLAVNKMDLVDWSEQQFRSIEQAFVAAVAPLGFSAAVAIPVSARRGDNVTSASPHMPWYTGPMLVAHLERVPSRSTDAAAPLRMPVQTVLRDGLDFRALAGTISSGTVRVGDEIADAGSGSRARVSRIATMDGDLDAAVAGKSVAIELDRDLDISRGAVLSRIDELPVKARRIEARLVWLSDSALDMDRPPLLRTTTDLVPLSSLEVTGRLDLDSLDFISGTLCKTNDVVAVALETTRPVAVDRFTSFRGTGAFLLIDPMTGGTLAAGVVRDANEEQLKSGSSRFVLTRALLERGICAGLGETEPDAREFKRRAHEVVTLLEQAGVRVELEGTTAGGAP